MSISAQLDSTALHTRRLDLTASAFGACVLVVLNMGPAIAKRGFDASDFELALITAGQSLGLLLSFFTAHLATRHGKSGLVFWPEILARIAIAAVFFVEPTWALAFVGLHVLAHTLQQMTLPARITIYRLNYPDHLRGRIVGRNRQVQLGISALLALAMSLALDWGDGREEVVALFGSAPFSSHAMLTLVLPLLAVAGLAGSVAFRGIRVRSLDVRADEPARSGLTATVGRFWRVWRQDHAYRRYECYFMVFGFANIMAMPLTRIHAVDVLDADYFDLAMADVVIMSLTMSMTLVFWGKRLDRHSPMRMRGLLNFIMSLDFLAFALAPTIEWIYVGRVFRGIAIGGGSLVWMLGALHYARGERDVPIYLGMHTFLTGVRWIVAPFVGVLLQDLVGGDARPVFALTFVILVATGGLMLFDSNTGNDDRHPEPDGTEPTAPRVSAT